MAVVEVQAAGASPIGQVAPVPAEPFRRRKMHPRRELMAYTYPKPPKRPLSSFTCYIRFYLRQYNRSMRRLRDGRAVMQILRNQFLELSRGHRQYFDRLSKETKNRYTQEVAQWKQNFKDQGKKRIPRIRKKSKQDPTLPARPLNGYIHFFKTVLPERRKKYPKMSYKDVVKKIGTEWKGMSKEHRRPYLDRARDSLAGYKSISKQLKDEKKQIACVTRVQKQVRRLNVLREKYKRPIRGDDMTATTNRVSTSATS